jgi:hypothetical protein
MRWHVDSANRGRRKALAFARRKGEPDGLVIEDWGIERNWGKNRTVIP